MNELQRTQRISIAVLVLAILLILGLMIKEKPKFVYSKTAPEMVSLLKEFDNVTPDMVAKEDIDNYVVIDVRSPYDFEVKHIKNAINMPIAFLLDDENIARLTEFKNANKTVVLYGQTERDAVSPWILLYQIGYTNTKILLGGFNCYLENTPNCISETARHDFAKIASQGGVKEVEVEKTVKKEEPKKVIPVKKKVKAAVEGGC